MKWTSMYLMFCWWGGNVYTLTPNAGEMHYTYAAPSSTNGVKYTGMASVFPASAPLRKRVALCCIVFHDFHARTKYWCFILHGPILASFFMLVFCIAFHDFPPKKPMDLDAVKVLDASRPLHRVWRVFYSEEAKASSSVICGTPLTESPLPRSAVKALVDLCSRKSLQAPWLASQKFAESVKRRHFSNVCCGFKRVTVEKQSSKQSLKQSY